jgi:dihydroorotase
MKLLTLLIASLAFAQGQYDLVLKGGHLIDPKNKISAVRDVAIANGRIAEVAETIPASNALKVVDASSLYVVPGLIDIHAHVYAGTGARGSYTGDNCVYPDGFTFRVGVTTVVDAGCAGAQNFADFKDRVIDRSRTRVLAFLNIVRAGMAGAVEQKTSEMVPEEAAAVAKQYPGLIVGFKTAHYAAADWIAVDRTVEAGRQANLPVMVDFGNNHPERPLKDLLLIKLRPGDIYTHVYSGLRGEQDETGHVNPALPEARKRGIIFDVGHGGGSFLWRIAVPAIKEGFVPDSISTDLHTGSMNTGMKDMLNVMSKFLVMGLSLDDVILRSTWNPAREIRHEELGHLSAGAPADVTVLRLEQGSFGFLDTYGARLRGSQKLTCELTIRDGRVVYDLNGIAAPDWDKLDPNYGPQGVRRPAAGAARKRK